MFLVIEMNRHMTCEAARKQREEILPSKKVTWVWLVLAELVRLVTVFPSLLTASGFTMNRSNAEPTQIKELLTDPDELV